MFTCTSIVMFFQMNIDGTELEFECSSNLASHLVETRINGKEVILQVRGCVRDNYRQPSVDRHTITEAKTLRRNI